MKLNNNKLTTYLAALALVGCNSESDNITHPPVNEGGTTLVVTSGVSSLTPNQEGYVNLSDNVLTDSSTQTTVTSVVRLNTSDECGEASVSSSMLMGFNTVVSGSEVCTYEFTVEAASAGNNTQQESAVMSVIGSTANEPLLVPIPFAMALEGSAPTTVPINIETELNKLGVPFPDGYTLSENYTLLGDGSVTVDAPQRTLHYTAINVGPHRIVYQLTDAEGTEHLFGNIDIAVSKEVNQGLVTEGQSIYPEMVDVFEQIDIDVSPYVTSPDGSDFQLVYVDSMTALVTAKDPYDLSNKTFTFSAGLSGPHYVSYMVSDHKGGFASGIIQVTVDAVPAAWSDIEFDGDTYSAPLTSELARRDGVVFSDGVFDWGYSPAINVALFDFSEANSYCTSMGRLPTQDELKSIYSRDNPVLGHNWPAERPYWASDNSKVHLNSGAVIESSETGYVTCIVGDLKASVQNDNNRAIADNEDALLFEVFHHNKGAPVVGEEISATISGSATLESTTATTGSDGVARFSATSNVAEAVVATFTVGGQQAQLDRLRFVGDPTRATIEKVEFITELPTTNSYASYAQFDFAEAQVTVKDWAGNPVEGAEVAVEDAENLNTFNSKVTDSNGEVILAFTNTTVDDFGDKRVTVSHTSSEGSKTEASESTYFVAERTLDINLDGRDYTFTRAFTPDELMAFAGFTPDTIYSESGDVGPDGMRVASLTWDNAVAFCGALEVGGHNDWRLPTKEELIALYDSTQPEASLGMWSKHGWPTRMNYWTSSSYDEALFYLINISTGDTHSGVHSYPGYVGCTRSKSITVDVLGDTYDFTRPFTPEEMEMYAGVTPDAVHTETGDLGPKGMKVGELRWNNASVFCDVLEVDGHNDWRLPSADELSALYDTTQLGVGVEKGVWSFYGWPAGLAYWTSTDYDNYHFQVRMYDGLSSYMDDNSPTYVSCIRDDIAGSSVTVDILDNLYTFTRAFTPEEMLDASGFTPDDTYTEDGGFGPDGMEVARLTWDNAVTYCEVLEAEGYTDWRLPTSEELSALYDTTQPDADRGMWTKYDWPTYYSYWSTTPSSSGYNGVGMNNGSVRNHSNSSPIYVSCIREVS